jgi:class 3 adenylate cyclase
VNFEQVLKEVLWCLVTEGGISYRRIRLSFGLDDDALEEVRRELIGVKRLAADVDGELLVWAPAARPAEAGDATRPRQPLPVLPAARTPPAAAATWDLPGAERRHLTVMFCDLADSTRLSARLDPEDMGDIIRAYQAAVSEAVRRFDGFIAKFMGDGVLVYFGYPHAHEKDAERATHAALAILEALPALNSAIAQEIRIRLSVRIGIATGLVVVGETIGEGAARENTVVGETPNLAARLQALMRSWSAPRRATSSATSSPAKRSARMPSRASPKGSRFGVCWVCVNRMRPSSRPRRQISHWSVATRKSGSCAAPGSRQRRRATARSYSSAVNRASANRRSSTPCAGRRATMG